ncbi:MAG: formyltransferase family protein, partial [Candidatus Omnitrophota bacterium]
MRIVFFGTGSFGVPSLKRLLGSAHEVVAVVTQPDKKKGRGWSVMPTQVKAAMEQIAPAMDILQPEKISDGEFIAAIRGMDPDIFVVVDYGRILGEELLDVPRKYCI